MPLEPIENGEYLHQTISKYSTIGDYNLKNGDIVAVFVEKVTTPDDKEHFIARYPYVDLYRLVNIMASAGMMIPFKTIRAATEEDGNAYNGYDPTRRELKFGTVILLSETCKPEILDELRTGEGHMNAHETIAGGGVYRKNNA